MLSLLFVLSSKEIAMHKISNILCSQHHFMHSPYMGFVGMFYSALEGINFIIVGIIMIWICSKSHHSGGGGEYMYIRGWIGAIASLIYGLLKILNMI